MSTTQGRKSTAALGQQEKSSVYDFLYHDPRRIASFLAQFDPYGHLTSLSHSKLVTETASEKASFGGDASIPLVAKVVAAGEMLDTEATASGLSRTYDPLWANALAFFDFLQQKDLLHRDIKSAGIGQFVLVSGNLTITSSGLMQMIYQHDAVKSRFYQTPDPVTGAMRTKDDVDIDVAAMKIIDHQIQAFIDDSGTITYSSLKNEGMIASSTDIMMQYGVVVDGKWNIIGIKNADPEKDVNVALAKIEAVKKTHASVGSLIHNIDLLTKIRLWLGRPLYCYGVTPLAVFREIGRLGQSRI